MTWHCTGIVDPKWPETSHCVIIYVTKTTNDIFPLIQTQIGQQRDIPTANLFFPLMPDVRQLMMLMHTIAVVLRFFTSNIIIIVI